MAGRGQVGPMDTVTHSRILSINKQGQLLYAKEPLHFYEPSMAGLDCGMSFAKTLLAYIPDNISVLLIPTAVGGSSITQWLGDSTHRQVKLLSNFHDKVQLAKNYGQIKAVLWHQGESDAHPARIPKYRQRLDSLFNKFRMAAGNDQLPIYMGELGSYARNANDWKMLNVEISNHAVSDTNSFVIATGDLKHKGDTVHFNAAGQRKMGQRMALAFVQTQHNLPLNRKGYRVQKSRR